MLFRLGAFKFRQEQRLLPQRRLFPRQFHGRLLLRFRQWIILSQRLFFPLRRQFLLPQLFILVKKQQRQFLLPQLVFFLEQ